MQDSAFRIWSYWLKGYPQMSQMLCMASSPGLAFRVLRVCRCSFAFQQDRPQQREMQNAETSREELFHHFSVHVGESKIASLRTIGQLLVIEAK